MRMLTMLQKPFLVLSILGLMERFGNGLVKWGEND